MNHYSHTTFLRRLFTGITSASLLIGGSLLGGCNDAQAGALLGAGIGALAGQAIGHDTTGTLIGAAIGTGAGYIIGNESDKERAAQASSYQQETYAPPPPVRRYNYRKPYSNQRHHSHHVHYDGCGHHY